MNNRSPSTQRTNYTLVDANGCAAYEVDTDNDGISDQDDVCEGFDDTNDSDDNGIPDDCEHHQDNVDNKFVTETEDNGDSAIVTTAILSIALGLLIIYWRKR